MWKGRLSTIATLAAGLQLFQTAPAYAATSFALLPATFATLAKQDAVGCARHVAPAVGVTANALEVGEQTKSAALLGKRVSQLELIALQQSGKTEFGSATLNSIAANSPAACQNLAILRNQPAATGPMVTGTEDFLGSKRLPVRHTTFDNAWKRVRDAGLSSSALKAISKIAEHSDRLAVLSAVNAWTNAKIRYVEDRVLYGKSDYWANAGTTLRRRAGDCEDIAIVKMQMLAGMGIARSDMYLTIARDLVRNADHALLIVKLDGRPWLLDNMTNELIDARQGNDYRPIMSFSTSQRWLHGFQTPATAQSAPHQMPVIPVSASS